MTEKTEIRDTAYGGYGVGTLPDGRVIFLPHTVKGDVVTYEITEDKKNFVYGTMLEVLEPSELRGESYCPHIGTCGGCVFGHIDYDSQFEIKKKFVTDNLDRNKIEYPEPDSVRGDILRFRNRATFRIKDKRIGFYKFKSNDFIPVDDCPVIKESMTAKAKAVAEKTDGGEYYLYITENEQGTAVGRTDAAVKDLCGFYGLKTSEKLLGSNAIRFSTKYGGFYADFGSFLQGNRFLSEKLQDFVFENTEGGKAVEFYCGAGFLTLPLAAKCRTVDAVESYKPSVWLAERTKNKNVKWHVAESEAAVQRLRGRYDMVVADPPRTGMDKRVCKFIKESGSKSMIYISCDPNTFARDIARLSENYKISKLTILDMFPGSYHVEIMALLKRGE